LLRSKVTELDKSATLADEYRMANEENISLHKEFVHVDMEGWV
jgi:hypothetical protein